MALRDHIDVAIVQELGVGIVCKCDFTINHNSSTQINLCTCYTSFFPLFFPLWGC